MLATTNSYILDGISAQTVRVEVDVHRGLPAFTILGLPDAAVRESRERIRAALINSGFEFPLKRIVVNLAPSGRRKAAPALDLAIAAALLEASNQLDWHDLRHVALAGELALDGSTRWLLGALPMAEAARESGAKMIAVPAENAGEAALASGIDVIAIESLSQLRDLAAGDWSPQPQEPCPLHAVPSNPPDFADLHGRPQLRRALEIAAAGAHSVLIIGPPGAGKSLAARRLPSILPPLSAEAAMEVARIASATGRFSPDFPGSPPFRAPHHTISTVGLLGGGTPPRPGEATLCHRGVLFLDELPEFRRDALEALRAPLTEGQVRITSAGGQRTLPSRFILVAAAGPSPCLCGQHPGCCCSSLDVQRHREWLKAALGGQLEIVIEVGEPTSAKIARDPGETSAEMRQRVLLARERQEARLGTDRCNADITLEEVARFCGRSEAASSVLAAYAARHGLRASGLDRVLRLALTIADLDGAEEIAERHATEALRLQAGGS